MEGKYLNYNLIKLVDKKKSIFVDCFDTLIYRICGPDVVLERWFHVIAEKYEVEYDVIKDIWKVATYTSNEVSEELKFQTVAFNIYNRFLYLQNKLKDFDEFYKYLLNSYIRIELEVLRVNYNLYNILEKEKEKGKNIYLVSDFYMPKEFFEKIFQELKIKRVFENIYVSSDVGYRKSTGSIYTWLLQKLNVKASDVIMIGDNKISDYQRPKEKGIEACRIQVEHLKNQKNVNYKLMDIFEKQLNERPLSNYGFSLYLFMRELLKYVEKNDVKDIYFCSREGEFFKEIFELLLEQNQLSKKVHTHYLLVSRKATFLPSLNPDIKKEKFFTLRKSTNCLSVKEFIITLGLRVEDLKLSKQIDIEKQIENFFQSEELRLLKNDKTFSEKYKKAVILEKNEFANYLESIGISKDTKTITLVDIGWRGTIQDNIYNFFDGNIRINGLYYGIEYANIFNEKNRKYGLVYSDVPVKSKYFSIFSTNHRMLERILQASHGTANYYYKGKCILATLEEKEKLLYGLMQGNREYIFNTIEELNKIFSENVFSDYQIRKIIAYLHEMYLMCYTKKLYQEERKTADLMLMTFGTGQLKASYKDMLKSVFRMSKVEKINKVLKGARRGHCNLTCNIIVGIVFHYRKKKFLKMEF